MTGVAAVVVTHDRKALLKRCLATLLAQTAPCDILLVDNASTDGTGAWARELAGRQPRLHYRSTGANLGGAGGFHYGVRWAMERGYSHVWLMDDDCLPRPDALEKLLEADALLGGASHYGFLSSVALWTDGGECRMNRQKLKKNCFARADLLGYGILPVEQATFVSLLVPAEAVRRAGLPIKEFFIWGDDIEYTRRLAVRLELPCYLAGRSRVVHAMAHNHGSSIAADVPDRLARYRFAYRNEAWLYRQEGARGAAYYAAKCGRDLWRILARARDHRLRRCGILLKGMAQGLLFDPTIQSVPKGKRS